MPNLNFQRLRLEAQALVEKNSKNPEKDEQLGNDVARILLENLKQGDKEEDIKKQHKDIRNKLLKMDPRLRGDDKA